MNGRLEVGSAAGAATRGVRRGWLLLALVAASIAGPAAAAPPAVPGNFSVVFSATPSNRFILSWDASAGATSYDLEKDYSFAGSLGGLLTYTDSYQMINGQSHWYRVRAVNGDGSSAWTAYGGGVVNPAPGAVTLSGTPGNQQNTLSWSGGSGATSFALQVQTGVWTTLASSSPYTHTGLTNGLSYTYRVAATNDGGTTYSSSNSYTPTPPPPPPPVADFQLSPASGAPPLEVVFADYSTNTPTSWAWNFGDGATSSAQHPTHTYMSGGYYTVTLTATNSYGSDTETQTQVVHVATEAELQAQGYAAVVTEYKDGLGPMVVAALPIIGGLLLLIFGPGLMRRYVQHVTNGPGVYGGKSWGAMSVSERNAAFEAAGGKWVEGSTEERFRAAGGVWVDGNESAYFIRDEEDEEIRDYCGEAEGKYDDEDHWGTAK